MMLLRTLFTTTLLLGETQHLHWRQVYNNMYYGTPWPGAIINSARGGTLTHHNHCTVFCSFLASASWLGNHWFFVAKNTHNSLITFYRWGNSLGNHFIIITQLNYLKRLKNWALGTKWTPFFVICSPKETFTSNWLPACNNAVLEVNRS